LRGRQSPAGEERRRVQEGDIRAGEQSSWFALLAVATDSGRRGRSFGLVSALSNLGVIAGASIASTAWAVTGLQGGIVSATAFLVLAIGSLAFVPSDRAQR